MLKTLKSAAQKALIIIFSFVLTCVLAEILLNAFNPEYAALKENFVKKTELFRRIPFSQDAFSGFHQPFPIFGIVLNSKWKNNYGFGTNIDYPYISKSPKKVIVGLFGGSVAEQQYPVLENLILNDDRVKNLKQKGFDIQFLNFAIGSTRQPEQFNIAVHFIEHLDILVNLDGINEAIMTAGKYYPPEFPVLTSEYYFLDAERFALREKMFRLRWLQLKILSPLASDNFLSRSTLFYLFAKSIRDFLGNIYHEAETRLRDSENIKVFDPEKTPTRNSVTVWEKFTLLQNLMVSHYGKTQLFFVQPNPHLIEMKALSEEEKTYIKDVSKNPDDYSASQYRLLLISAKAVKKQGVTLYDMTPVFSGVADTVYMDDCCHLNVNGKLILGKAMAPTIIDSILKKARGG